MIRYHSTWPYDQVTQADYDGCDIPVRTGEHARQYALDTVRLADGRKPSTGKRGGTVPDLAAEKHAAEARRLHDVADRRRELATDAESRGWASADPFRRDADHFQRLADWHASQARAEQRAAS